MTKNFPLKVVPLFWFVFLAKESFACGTPSNFDLNTQRTVQNASPLPATPDQAGLSIIDILILEVSSHRFEFEGSEILFKYLFLLLKKYREMKIENHLRSAIEADFIKFCDLSFISLVDFSLLPETIMIELAFCIPKIGNMPLFKHLIEKNLLNLN